MVKVICIGHFASEIGTAHAQYHVIYYIGGLGKPHIWNCRPHFAYLLYKFYGATMTIKGRLLLSVPIVKRFSAKNFQSTFCQNLMFGGHKKGLNING